MEDAMKEFCKLPLPERSHQSYLIGLTLLHYLDIYNFTYKASCQMLSNTIRDKTHLYGFWNYHTILEPTKMKKLKSQIYQFLVFISKNRDKINI